MVCLISQFSWTKYQFDFIFSPKKVWIVTIISIPNSRSKIENFIRFKLHLFHPKFNMFLTDVNQIFYLKSSQAYQNFPSTFILTKFTFLKPPVSPVSEYVNFIRKKQKISKFCTSLLGVCKILRQITRFTHYFQIFAIQLQNDIWFWFFFASDRK